MLDDRYNFSRIDILCIINSFYCDAKRAEISESKGWQYFTDIMEWWEKNSERFKRTRK